jgi:uncharacterized membrane protein
MDSIPWILISVAILIIVLGVLAFFISRKNKRPVDYYNLFIIGLIWLIIGIPTKNTTLLILGFAFALSGIVNKNKWKKNRRDWSKLKDSEKKVVIFLMVLMSILVILGLVLFYIKSVGIV